jgi:RNA polymerase sigma-70 factor (ECF subfamily)
MTNWDAVIREFGPVVWRTAYRLLTHEPDAADCFQRTFIAAVELEAAEPIRNWPAVLKRLATARALEQLRGRHRRAARSVGLPEEPLADCSAPDPVELACGGELAAALRTALSAIDPVQAEVFCLVCLEGLPHQDAAAALGITANHVGVLLHRARVTLRDHLRAFDPNREHAPGGRP